jgi:hypothetical protein
MEDYTMEMYHLRCKHLAILGRHSEIQKDSSDDEDDESERVRAPGSSKKKSLPVDRSMTESDSSSPRKDQSTTDITEESKLDNLLITQTKSVPGKKVLIR